MSREQAKKIEFWSSFCCGHFPLSLFLFFVSHFNCILTPHMSPLNKPLVTIETTQDLKLGNGRWLSLHEVAFNDPSGTERKWEVCRRIKPAAALTGSKPEGEMTGPSVDGKKFSEASCNPT
jgi:hypothetical protein